MFIPTAGDVLYQLIQSKLLSGEFKPDDKINIDELSREFNTSKTPVREVLKKLEQEGLLSYYPRVGWKVKKLTKKEHYNIFEVQKLIEMHIISNLSEYIAKIDVIELQNYNEEIAKAIEEKRYDDIYLLNEKFHMCIYDVFPNDYLLDILQNIWNSIKMQRNIILTSNTFLETIIKEHNDLIKSIENKDVKNLIIAQRQCFISGENVLDTIYKDID